MEHIVSATYVRGQLAKRLPELPDKQRWYIIQGVILRTSKEVCLRIYLQDYKWTRGWKPMRYPTDSEAIGRHYVSTRGLTESDISAIVEIAHTMKKDMDPSYLYVNMLGAYAPRKE